MAWQTTDMLTVTRPDGTSFTINANDGALATVLSYPENQGADIVQTSTPEWVPDSATTRVNSSTALSQSPTGGPSSAGQSAGAGRSIVYRLILQSAPGRVDTGATYPACTRDNPDGCGPMQFSSVGEAVQYALAHGEVPYMVSSVNEVWGIVDGSLPIHPNQILQSAPGALAGMDWSTLLTLGGLALFFLKKRG